MCLAYSLVTIPIYIAVGYLAKNGGVAILMIVTINIYGRYGKKLNNIVITIK